jgi:hypothetical protein
MVAFSLLPITIITVILISRHWVRLLIARVIFVIVFLVSVSLNYLINMRNFGGWISNNEHQSLEKVKSLIPIGSLILTQGNNSPLIRLTLPQRYVIGNIPDGVLKTIYFGSDIEKRIMWLNILTDTGFQKLDSLLAELEVDANQIYLKMQIHEYSEINFTLAVRNHKSTLESLLDQSIIPCGRVKPKTLSLIDEERAVIDSAINCRYNLQIFRNRGEKDIRPELFIVHSSERNMSPYSGQSWWDSGNLDTADISFFDNYPKCFKKILTDKTLRVWKFLNCPHSSFE